jgi:hypothetical protein
VRLWAVHSDGKAEGHTSLLHGVETLL